MVGRHRVISIPGQVFSSAEAAARTDQCGPSVCERLLGWEYSLQPSVRSLDLMQLVAEIASYEDFVDEGNYNVVDALDETVLNKTVKAQHC